MKKKNCFLTLLILLFPLFSFCQIIPQDIVDRVNKSAYIFEGEVIRNNGYWTEKKNYIYTSITVDIKKIFKGHLLCGKVELITNGGIVGDSVELDISHNLVLNKGQRGIFLCRETNKELPIIDYYPENNYQKLETIFNEQGFIKFFEDGINPEVWDYQFSLDSIAQAYNLLELYTQINYVDCYPSVSVFSSDSIENIKNLENLNIPSDKSDNLLVINKTSHSINTNFNDTNITCTLENQQITSSNGHKYFEFDISLSDSLSGIYFYDAVVKFKYDTLSFGSRIRARQKLTATRANVILDTIAYGRPGIADAQNDVAVITIPGRAQTITSYYQLTTNPSPAVHIQIEILDCGHTSSIVQIASSTFANYTISPNMVTPNFQYDTINIANTIAFIGCGSMYINSIAPYVAHAGIQDTITIKGSGFGNIRGTGNVFLKNADNGGQTYLQLDSMDYLPNGWSDTLITFILPSVVDTSNLNAKRATPGSGFVRVRNNNTDSTNSLLDQIIIEYGISNNYYRNPVGKYFTNLTPIDASKSFSFRPDSSFSNHSDRMTCLESTIKQWVCLTAVNFKVGSTYNTGDSIAITDTICSVSFGNLDSSTVANTSQWRYFRGGNCNTAYCSEMDVFVNKDLIYFTDTSNTANVPVGKYDLFQVLLHEFGHAHMLTHVNNPANVMWWQSSDNGILANDRRIELYNDQSASDGGNFVVNHSINIDTVNCPFIRMSLGTSYCTRVGISEISKPNLDYSIYPNPVSSDLHLAVNFEKFEKYKISISDLFGREIIQITQTASAGKSDQTIATGSLYNGFYLFKITVGNFEYIEKFVKQ